MRFATPAALLLLLVIVPFLVWVGLPRLAYRRRRDTISLGIRLVIVVLLVFSLAGLQTIQASDKLAVIFLVDSSDSLDSAARTQAESFIRDSLSKMTPNDRAGIVVFGKNALVERPISVAGEFLGITSSPVQLATDIGGAIRLGLAMFPPDAARRLVILSDGLETMGSAIDAARLAAATNVQIDVYALQRQQGPEVLVTEIRVPTTVNAGEEFDLAVTIESQINTTVNVTVLSGGAVIQTTTEDLSAGVNNLVLPKLRVPEQGFVNFQVRVDPLNPAESDTYYQNNELSSFTEVTGPPKVLLIASKLEEVAALLPILRQAGLIIDVAAPNDLPIGLAPLAAYKSVVMVDVPASDLNEARMKALQSYVRDLGGGLVVVGGPNSYGVGGYYQTPLEEILPVEMQIKDQKRIPRLTMVYVIDRSGSMEMVGSSGITNLELAKEAARRSISFLFERDRAGVLSFDSNPQWLVPIQFVANRRAIIEQIGALRPGGGTDIFAAVAEIARTVPADPSTLKHVILLTDGGSDESGVVETVQRMHDQFGITVTAIGIGTGIPPFMRRVAQVGGGQYYALADLASVPQVFAAETVLATRSYIMEEEITPLLTANSPIMRGIETVPILKGYVATTAKPTSTVVLTSPLGGFNDPLLATWQYGLGRVAAWTSDATTRWAQNWTGWEGFQRFWSQVIRSTIVTGIDNNLEARVEDREGRSVLIVEARDEQGSLINSLNLEGVIVDPRLNGQQLKLRQVAPGRYEAEFDPGTEGAYFIRVAGGNPEGITLGQTAGWVLSYSPEYLLRQTNIRLLDQIAELSNGRRLSSDEPAAIFRHDIREERAAAWLFPLLLALAAFLLPVDIGVRRLIITQSDLVKLRAWLRNKLGLQDQLEVVPTSARIAALKDAKIRATGTMPTVLDAPLEGGPLPSTARESSSAEDAVPSTESARKTAEMPAVAPAALASRLAEKRRQQKQQD